MFQTECLISDVDNSCTGCLLQEICVISIWRDLQTLYYQNKSLQGSQGWVISLFGLVFYHTIWAAVDLPQLTLCWPIAHAVPEWEESVGVFPGVGDVPLPPCFCWRCVCLRGRKKEDRRALCLLFYELGLYVEFLWGCALLIVPELASSVIPTLARTRGLGALKPGYTHCPKKRHPFYFWNNSVKN